MTAILKDSTSIPCSVDDKITKAFMLRASKPRRKRKHSALAAETLPGSRNTCNTRTGNTRGGTGSTFDLDAVPHHVRMRVYRSDEARIGQLDGLAHVLRVPEGCAELMTTPYGRMLGLRPVRCSLLATPTVALQYRARRNAHAASDTQG